MSAPLPHADSSPPSEPEKKPRGCVFYGCLIAGVLGVLLVIVVGGVAWLTYGATRQLVAEYAEDAPAPIPVVEKPPADVKAIADRIDRFADDLAADRATGPLVLSADEVNAVIASVDQLKGIVAVDFSGDRLRADVSLPLSRLGFPFGTIFPGKYLNGVATIDARIEDGRPVVKLVGLDAKGKPVPDAFLAALREQNILQDIGQDAGLARAAKHLESISVKDGRLILTPRSPAKDAKPAGKPEDEPAPEAKTEPPR